MRAMAGVSQLSTGGRISFRGSESGRQRLGLVVPRQQAVLPSFPHHTIGTSQYPLGKRNIEVRALDPQSLMTMLGGAISLQDIGAFSFACVGSAMLVGSIKMLEYKGHVHKVRDCLLCVR